MVRELPLLFGAIGTVLGFLTLPWMFFLLILGSASGRDYPLGPVAPLSSELFFLGWTASPLLGLASAFKVKQHGKLGGLLFLTAGTLPWLGALLSSGTMGGGVVFIFWTPLLILAGGLAILNLPGPYVDKEEMEDAAG